MWSFDRQDVAEDGRSGKGDGGLRVVDDVVVVDTLSTFTGGVVDFFIQAEGSEFVVLYGSVMAVMICADMNAQLWSCRRRCSRQRKKCAR